MGKKDRKPKNKLKKQRTLEERKEEVEKVKGQLTSYELYEGIEAIDILYKKMNLFVESGIAESGKIDYEDNNIPRVIHYIFTNNKKISPCINLKILVKDRNKVKGIING